MAENSRQKQAGNFFPDNSAVYVTFLGWWVKTWPFSYKGWWPSCWVTCCLNHLLVFVGSCFHEFCSSSHRPWHPTKHNNEIKRLDGKFVGFKKRNTVITDGFVEVLPSGEKILVNATSTDRLPPKNISTNSAGFFGPIRWLHISTHVQYIFLYYLESIVYHIFRQVFLLVLGVKLMEINSNWYIVKFIWSKFPENPENLWDLSGWDNTIYKKTWKKSINKKKLSNLVVSFQNKWNKLFLVIQSALFIPDRWRSRFHPLKGSRFHHPKKVTLNHLVFCSTKALKNHDISVIVRRYINAILSSSGVDWHGGHFQGIFPWCSIGIKIWCIIYLIETSATHDGNFTFSKQDAYTMKTWTAQSILKRQPASLQVAVHFHILSSTLPPKPATVA